MALTPEQSKRISEAVGQKARNCPLCGERKWGWGPDLIVLQSQRFETATSSTALTEFLRSLGLGASPPGPPPIPLPPPERPIAAEVQLAVLAGLFKKEEPPAAYPLLPLICNNCGNTILLNVYILGIADIWPAVASGKTG